ncbi:hypothetical protein LTR10_014215 [Elasticomyces elasticus]|uniref:EamA domain-containing protein n=1 Tax=Exophiala sideris TaxID=1016849 RepID=A0ABR0JI46_9EURO|nr:hypothetical protein LTR10_014215 [Elasticomyces elasticus]KAK5034256.1 hypothetical protein LTS07_003176 [Exophiala sideris]KAK5042552.1 hypothetical protein LTR13_001399 [Exophiala sideris]KAK5065634.1 hypothetical protein LTR69_003183 [Exophiala sideris]KAK5185907.1 hypothetical protein LTR44_001956 [Eurotiomycetes sp. CCFEE 6388]
MDDDSSSARRNSSRHRLLDAPKDAPTTPRPAGLARHTLGLILLLCVVFLWTMSNFLGSSLFADRTYAKPFFLTYLNTSMFMLAMIPTLFRIAYRRQRKHGDLYIRLRSAFTRRRRSFRHLRQHDTIDPEDSDSAAFIGRAKSPSQTDVNIDGQDKHLGIAPTARLSFTFCFLWFAANYFAMSCLQHTTVASATILTSTSSFWTLLIGALTHTEKFTWRKLCGVLGSLVGIILISQVDLSPNPESKAGRVLHMFKRSVSVRAEDTFPDKSSSEIAFGDALALLSAIIYGVYTVTLKNTTVKALPRSLNMPLFFGLVGLFNLILLSPLLPVLHYTGIERFRLPPSRRIWTILLVNSVSSLLSDICWAYAMVLTSPLVVTVGLSLTIPLSLVGEMVLQGHYEGWVYWLGAAVVVGSFLFVDHEEREEETGNEPVAPEVRDGDDENAPTPRPEDHQHLLGSSGERIASR